MRPTEIIGIVGFILCISFLYNWSIGYFNQSYPGANVTSVPDSGLNDQISDLQNQTQTIANIQYSSSVFDLQLLQAFGMSVFAGLSVAKIAITFVINGIMLPGNIISFILLSTGNPFLGMLTTPLSTIVTIGMAIILIVAIARVFKPDL